MSAELQKRIEQLEYELQRFHEARANQPDWEQLWAEQKQRVEELERVLELRQADINHLDKRLADALDEIERLKVALAHAVLEGLIER